MLFRPAWQRQRAPPPTWTECAREGTPCSYGRRGHRTGAGAPGDAVSCAAVRNAGLGDRRYLISRLGLIEFFF